MMTIESFTFGPFVENTYLLFNEQRDCLIIDPGCQGPAEEQQLADYIAGKQLRPVKLLNTHGHIDHIIGNKFIFDKFGLKPYLHEADLQMFSQVQTIGKLYGIEVQPSPEPAGFIDEGDVIQLGDDKLEVIFTPGHSPGSVVFYSKSQQFLIGGDVLFYESIGRTDLPGGDHEVLMQTIRHKILPLGDAVEVHPGHGPVTTIAHERAYNPFIN